ncbi:hypothetical protein [Nocardia aurea]|uniref:Uncharacterized protein n=1 Tax=Nocardia aurea TaxID=2144174 RepID=A0ABV3G0H1_9NOCA
MGVSSWKAGYMGAGREVSNAALVKLLKVELGEALSAHGFVASEALDPTWGRWYARRVAGGVSDVVSAVAVGFGQDRYGGVSVAGYAVLQSRTVNDILVALPAESRLKYETEDRLPFAFLHYNGFGDFLDPPYTALTHVVIEPSQVAGAAEWFTGQVSDHVEGWLAERDSLDKLIVLARTPSPRAPDNISPSVFRRTVVLCIANGRFSDAAALMAWYLQRGKFNVMDSMEKTTAFDIALSEMFPVYAAARLRE